MAVPPDPKLVAALGGRATWSDAVIVGDVIWVSGQIGLDKNSGKLPEGFEAQTVQLFENLRDVLERCGSSLENVAMTHIYLTDPEVYKTFDRIYHRYFPKDPPARPDIVAEANIAGALIAIEVVAARG